MVNSSEFVDYRISAPKWLLGVLVFTIVLVCGYAFEGVEGISNEISVLVDKCLLQVGLPASLIGFFAARKNRNPLPWAAVVGVTGFFAGFIPLIIGLIAMAFVPAKDGAAEKSETTQSE